MDREDSAPSLRSSRPGTSPGGGSRSTTTLGADPAAIAKCFPNRRAPPAVIAIFGAGGDLTKRLVVPALYKAFHARQRSGTRQKVDIEALLTE